MPLFSRYALSRSEAERLIGRPLRGDPMRGEKAAVVSSIMLTASV